MLEFKGKRQANNNIVDGKRRFVILESKATMMDQVNQTQGKAKTTLAKAQTTSKRINVFFRQFKQRVALRLPHCVLLNSICKCSIILQRRAHH
jgi:hypothetical protein